MFTKTVNIRVMDENVEPNEIIDELGAFLEPTRRDMFDIDNKNVGSLKWKYMIGRLICAVSVGTFER